jgi:hypothetical protein
VVRNTFLEVVEDEVKEARCRHRARSAPPTIHADEDLAQLHTAANPDMGGGASRPYYIIILYHYNVIFL